ncbi:MAG: hypothetical protein OXG35_24560, partial [Acidobacteria bacterium]|nr:hypothetical protein [Acidobacteriota bacterium]
MEEGGVITLTANREPGRVLAGEDAALSSVTIAVGTDRAAAVVTVVATGGSLATDPPPLGVGGAGNLAWARQPGHAHSNSTGN